MEGFIMFILYFVLGFYLLGLIGRLALRLWIRRMQKQFEQNPNGQQFRSYTWGAGQNQNRNNQREEKKPEGEVTVTNKESHKRLNDNIGDYVDFEEIKD